MIGHWQGLHVTLADSRSAGPGPAGPTVSPGTRPGGRPGGPAARPSLNRARPGTDAPSPRALP
eukprot:765698-Hanusia_phi.AAC.1